MDLAMVSGGAGFGAGLIGDTVQKMLVPGAMPGAKYRRQDSAIASALVHSATFIGLMSLYNPRSLEYFGAVQLAIQAIGSDMAAEYVGAMLFDRDEVKRGGFHAIQVVDFQREIDEAGFYERVTSEAIRIISDDLEKEKNLIMPWYGSKNTWKNVGKTVSKPFGSNGGGNVTDAVAKGLWGGNGKDIGNAFKDVYGVGKSVTNEVWGTAKGVLTTAEGLVGGVSSLLNGNTILLLGGAAIVAYVEVMNTNKVLMIAVVGYIAYTMLKSRNNEPDLRKEPSSRVSQYQVGPYQKSYGNINYTLPRTRNQLMAFNWRSSGDLSGRMQDLSEIRRRVTIDPGRRDTNYVKF
ncbi:hypothetical protein RFI_39867 [Reticulomyxa filosa]|uniref:Uncharacterized protein n=1 Tax=Reticulomyxa filosa TaxID=46433 RepID=X6LA92_RETFI|nr:hypothetical protein RFI_39867 [Reticulomyxa filosa]|eukprot:ETN97659.1 hypothetical protein RFI_39867 [Reticulomyxa filosa]